jgi:pimeloyl-ACP methyl ester carboxylesterase
VPTVDANGIAINYTVEGAGPPLILLHGATSSPLEDWAAQRPAFRRAFRIYLVDARGHAGTKWDARDGFSNEMLVADLLAFADALGLDTFHLVGFSMGAMTSMRFAATYPDRLRTAIICGIDVFREPRASVARRLMDPARILREEPGGPRSWIEGTGRCRATARGRTCCRQSPPMSPTSPCRRRPSYATYGCRHCWSTAIATFSCRPTMPWPSTASCLTRGC